MNRETLKSLEQSEDKRAMGITNLAKVWDMDYRETENLDNSMEKQLDDPDETQNQYEAAMDAEFNIWR